MKKSLLHLHRERIVPAVRRCCGRFGSRAVIVAIAVLIGVLAALATSLMHAIMMFPESWETQLWQSADGGWRPAFLGFALLPFAGLALSFLSQPQLVSQPRER